ncbi:hypothetical protein ACFX13_032187 [Malus domestica]|nr:ATPase WRNIP1 [Malus domestica]
MEMEQLLSMGFPSELAAQALAATGTGGNSILKATEWILNRESSTSAGTSTNPSPISSGRPCQPKLDRFFLFQSKPPSSDYPRPVPASARKLQEESESTPAAGGEGPEEEAALSKSKRLKLAIPANPKNANKTTNEPLSERMRPRTLDDVVGQDHLLAPNSLLRSAIDCERLPSLVFWGPPGVGKTSIAKSIINSASRPCSSYRFVSLSAVTCGVKDVRDAIDEARKKKQAAKKKQTVLFVDEVHRFNKSQQDSFLPVIEDGSIVFMGATTENPSFHLIRPLLSRCRVLVLHPLRPHAVELLLKRAANDSDKGLAPGVQMPVHVNDEAIHFISANCDGDARVALNALEVSATTAAARAASTSSSTISNSTPTSMNDDDDHNKLVATAVVTLEDAKEALQCKHVASDKAGEEHYNLISALHKSMRGSDANAAIYWLARMLEGGQEPLYIARRLIRFASEDVGLADPSALSQAVACHQACHFLGMPECNVILAQCVAYLALAPKSVAVYKAIGSAQQVVRDSVGQNEGVPLHLRNAPTKLMKELGYANGYIYPPDNPSASATQAYLPPSLEGYKFLDWPITSNSTKTKSDG